MNFLHISYTRTVALFCNFTIICFNIPNVIFVYLTGFWQTLSLLSFHWKSIAFESHFFFNFFYFFIFFALLLLFFFNYWSGAWGVMKPPCWVRFFQVRVVKFNIQMITVEKERKKLGFRVAWAVPDWGQPFRDAQHSVHVKIYQHCDW